MLILLHNLEDKFCIIFKYRYVMLDYDLLYNI